MISQIDRKSIAFDPTSAYWLDVEVLYRTLTTPQSSTDLVARQAAVDLYRGEFLNDFHVQNAPVFDAWVIEQRQHLHILVVEALFTLVREYLQCGDHRAALSANRRLLQLEPWSEPVHRQQMLILAQTGARSAAIAQYEDCRTILAAEFGVEPLAKTKALYTKILAGEIETKDDGGDEKIIIELESEVGAQLQEVKNKVAESIGEFANGSAVPTTTVESPLQLSGRHIPQRTKLYGRQAELAQIRRWIVEEGCALVAIFGMGGHGKSALASTLARDLVEGDGADGGVFHAIIWQSLLNAPPLTEILQGWIDVLSGQPLQNPPTSLEQQFRHLLDHLRRQRSLLILDNLESILGGDLHRGDLHSGDLHSGDYRSGYEMYGQLIRLLAEEEHQSCLLITSRERPKDLIHFEEETPAVRFLSLPGLPIDAGRRMLAARGMAGDDADLAGLVQRYSGNPLALKLVAETVDTLFDGQISPFMQFDSLIFDDIRDVLDQQFARLIPLEHELLIWLAIVREPVSYPRLRSLLAKPPASRPLLEAMRSLQRRSLLEKYEDGFGLQNVVLEYITDLVVENMGRELTGETDRLSTERTNPDHAHSLSSPQLAVTYFNHYALILAQVKEYVRASQTRLLLEPVAKQLVDQLGKWHAEERLQSILADLRAAPPKPGYAAANLLHLLLQLGTDPRRADFSGLHLRQLYLRGVSLPQANFANAEITDSVFTEPFGLVFTAVFSPDGQYLAAGMNEGAIYLWRTADQQLVEVIQAHSQAVHALAFTERTTALGDRELLMASASDDASVVIWTLSNAPHARHYMQLTHEQQKSVLSVAFHADGQRVVSVDVDGHVSVWDVSDHRQCEPLQQFTTTPTRFGLMAYSGNGQTMAVGNRDGTVQVREVATGESAVEFTVESGPITALAMSRDGRSLVTGGADGQLSLWRVPEGTLQQVIATTNTAVDALVFSQDGRVLASTHGVGDHAVRLWAVADQGKLRLQHTLTGHTHVIWTAAFWPSPTTKRAEHDVGVRQLLVTGGSDQTVRVWDITTGQTLYTLRGQPRGLAALAIHARRKSQAAVSSPSAEAAEQAAAQAAAQNMEWLLAAVGYDHLVHLWEGRGTQAAITLQPLPHSRHALYTVAISPNGRIVAAAGHDRSIYLWEVESSQLLQILEGHTDVILCVAFHPDGNQLVSGGEDGIFRFWDLTQLEKQSGGRCRQVSAYTTYCYTPDQSSFHPQYRF